MSDSTLKTLKNELLSFRQDWEPDGLSVTVIDHSYSNKVYKIQYGSEYFLGRMYQGDVTVESRVEEIQRTKKINTMGFGSAIVHLFAEGRIEKWIDGRPLTYHEMINPRYQRLTAELMRKFHEITHLSHNDVHRNNIMLLSNGSLSLIDFEYSDKRKYSYDIANYFVEWMYPYEGEKPWEPRVGLFPDSEQQRRFIGWYIGSDKESMIEGIRMDVLSQIEYSHRFWLKWCEKYPGDELIQNYKAAREKLFASHIKNIKVSQKHAC